MHTDQQLVEILEENRMNKLLGNKCCASHNYYDANEAMAEAFENLFGFEVDPMNETHCSIWSKGWISAQDGEFWYNSFTAIRPNEIRKPRLQSDYQIDLKLN